MELKRICRLPTTIAATGDSRSGLYAKIKVGLFTPPVAIGAHAVGWPENEIAAINQARIAGQSDEAIRELVRTLVAERASGNHCEAG